MDAGRREWISHSGAEQGWSHSGHEDPAGRRCGAKIPLAVQPAEPHGKRCTQLFVDTRHRGDTTQKRAYLTEGPLKGDIASYFANDALFVCLGGVNAHRGCGKRSSRSASQRSWRRWTWISLQIRRSGRLCSPCAARCRQFRVSGTINVPGTRALRVWTIICWTGRNEGRLKERNCV